MIFKTAGLPVLMGLMTALAGCGGAELTASDVKVPQALIEPFPAEVGIYYEDTLRDYVHSEERWGSQWQVKLGATHMRMLDKLMQMAFRRAVTLKSLKEAPAGAAIGAILRPSIEQYSFITPRDTTSNYYAVTIKYRLDVLTPDGRPADSISFTGYGSAPAGSLSGSDEPMMRATRAAMRDAAAKFLVQFPQQPVAQRLRAGEPLIQVVDTAAPAVPAQSGEVEEVTIEPVPIVDPAGDVGV